MFHWSLRFLLWVMLPSFMSSLTVCSLPREYDPLQGVFADDHDQAHYVVLPQDEFYNAVMAKAGLKPDQDNAIRYFEAALRVANLHPR